MDNVLKIATPNPDETVKKLIEWTEKQNFDSLVVIGYKEGSCFIEHSRIVGISEFLGSIERAKLLLIKDDIL